MDVGGEARMKERQGGESKKRMVASPQAPAADDGQAALRRVMGSPRTGVELEKREEVVREEKQERSAQEKRRRKKGGKKKQ